MKQTLTTVQFANALGVSRDVVEKRVKTGKVKGSKQGHFPGRTSPNLIPASEVERVKKLQKK